MAKQATQAAGRTTGQADGKESGPAKAAPTRIGIVDSDKRNKTRRVVVKFHARHSKYGKYVANRTILHVHDENNESKTGDVVEVAECRPISKTKSWKLVRVVDSRQGK